MAYKFLFEIKDENGVRWAGKQYSAAVWLLRNNSDDDMFWTTVRILSEAEVEEYQRMAGYYPRA